MNTNDDRTPLERLRGSLYRRNSSTHDTKRRQRLAPREFETPAAWEERVSHTNTKKSPVIPFITKFFLGSVIFFIIALSITLFVFLRGSNIVSSENVAIVVSGPTSIDAGEEVTIQIIIENNNPTSLEFVDLILTFPEGTREAGNVERELKRKRTSLDVIAPREIVTESVSAVFFGQEGSIKQLLIELEYRVTGSNAIFVAKEIYDIVIGSSPIDLSIQTLKETSSGQELELIIVVRSNSTEIVEDLLLAIDAPFGFTYIGASPQPIYNNAVWNIGDLEPGGERVISVRGTLDGQDGEEKVFRVEAGAISSSDTKRIGVVYNSALSEIKIGRPFLGLQFTLMGAQKEVYAIPDGKEIQAELFWTNNVPVKITNAQIELRFKGAVLDKGSVSVRGGFFRSINNTIIWNGQTDASLQTIEPGEKGTLSFSFRTLPLFGQGGSTFKNPLIEIEMSVSGERISQSGVPETVRNTTKRELKVISDVALTSRAVYFDGPFLNQGPLPPKVDTDTTYTIVWTVVNSSNTISRARVEAKLPSYVRWTGLISPSGEDVTYAERDRSIVWDLGVIRDGVGLASLPREVSFQVVFTPSLSQRDTSVTLLEAAVFSGNDEFADVVINRTAHVVTTRLTSDPQFNVSQGKVVE